MISVISKIISGNTSQMMTYIIYDVKDEYIHDITVDLTGEDDIKSSLVRDNVMIT